MGNAPMGALVMAAYTYGPYTEAAPVIFVRHGQTRLIRVRRL